MFLHLFSLLTHKRGQSVNASLKFDQCREWKVLMQQVIVQEKTVPRHRSFGFVYPLVYYFPYRYRLIDSFRQLEKESDLYAIRQNCFLLMDIFGPTVLWEQLRPLHSHQESINFHLSMSVLRHLSLVFSYVILLYDGKRYHFWL